MKITAGLSFIVILAITAVFVWLTMVGKNDPSHTLIKQVWPSGDLSCITEPGLYWEGMATIYKYEKSRSFYFNSSKERVNGRGWEGEADDEDDIAVTLSRNAGAGVSGFAKYTLPTNCDDLIALHRVYQSDSKVKHDLIRNTVIAAVKKTAPMFTAEEAKVTRIAEFRRLAEDQLTDGEYLTITEEREERSADVKDADGKVVRAGESQKYVVTKLRLDSLGQRIIVKRSPLTAAGIRINQFEIKDIKLDPKAQQGLDIVKEREMQRIANTTAAETAKQKAITAAEEGKARVAEENANQQVDKIRAVVQAQKEKEVAETQAKKEYEVARLQALKAVEDAKRIRAEGEAEAAANRAKVSAGLAPQERFQGEIQMNKDKWDAISRIQVPIVPTNMITSSGKGVSGIDLLGDAKALETLMGTSNK